MTRWQRRKMKRYIRKVNVKIREFYELASHKMRKFVNSLSTAQQWAIVTVALLVVVATVAINLTSSKARAAEQPGPHEHCFFLQHYIQDDDTLWGIAEQYNNCGEKTKQYINELQSINSMGYNTVIKHGNSLIIKIHTYRDVSEDEYEAIRYYAYYGEWPDGYDNTVLGTKDGE